MPGLASLSIRSVDDIQWMPPLTALTKLDLEFTWDSEADDYAGALPALPSCNASLFATLAAALLRHAS